VEYDKNGLLNHSVHIYDFMGIPHCDEENHSNYGVYRFKKGFNGEIVKYAGEFDYYFFKCKAYSNFIFAAFNRLYKAIKSRTPGQTEGSTFYRLFNIILRHICHSMRQ